MDVQQFEQRNETIRRDFKQAVHAGRVSVEAPPRLSWSIWLFGREAPRVSLERLRAAGLEYVELAGNHHTRESGTGSREMKSLLSDLGLQTSGVCGLYSPDVDLASDNAFRAQNAVDYVRREIEFVHEMGGEYLIVVPSAVGRPQPLGSEEFARSAERLALLAPEFAQAGVKAAVEPIRADEVSLIHTVSEAKTIIDAVDHSGVRHINGDVYHMLFSETHIGQAVLEAGEQLANLHLADSNRGTLGSGMMDLDTILRSYLLATGGKREASFLTGEPIGAGRDPYSALTTVPDADLADLLVKDSIAYLSERWEAVKAEAAAEG